MFRQSRPQPAVVGKLREARRPDLAGLREILEPRASVAKRGIDAEDECRRRVGIGHRARLREIGHAPVGPVKDEGVVEQVDQAARVERQHRRAELDRTRQRVHRVAPEVQPSDVA